MKKLLIFTKEFILTLFFVILYSPVLAWENAKDEMEDWEWESE